MFEVFEIIYRFFYPFGLDVSFNSKRLEDALHHYRMTGASVQPQSLLSTLGPAPSLQQQLDTIGSIGHATENIPRHDGDGFLREAQSRAHFPYSFVTCKEVSEGKYTPHALRPRLCHFMLDDDWLQVQRLCPLLLGASMPGLPTRHRLESGRPAAGRQTAGPSTERETAGPSTEGPPRPSAGPWTGQEVEVEGTVVEGDGVFQVAGPSVERRATTVRRHRITAQQLQQQLRLQEVEVRNQASEMTSYESYKTSMVSEGCLVWAKHQVDHEIFVLNNYDCETSEFQEEDFVFVEFWREDQQISCQCDTYRLRMTASLDPDCLHCRFLEEEVVPYVEVVRQENFSPTTYLERKLKEAWENCNNGCLQVGTGKGRVGKFCVRGRDNTMSFVHLSLDGCYVRCVSGECSVGVGFSKKLQALETSERLCPHLDMFKASREQWEPYLRNGEEENECEDGGDLREPRDFFNKETGLWNFGGKSQHRPSGKEDEKLKR